MIKRTICRLAYALIYLIAIHVPAVAQFEEGKETIILNSIVGSAIIPGATKTVIYSKAPGEADKKIKNIVTLKINEQSTTFFKSDFTAVVDLKIESWEFSNPLSTTIQIQYKSLEVNFASAVGASFDARAYVLPGISQQVKITVESITITGNTN